MSRLTQQIKSAWISADIALKQLTMRWAGRASSWTQLLLPRTNLNYEREIGDGWRSSVVLACLLWVGRNFPEAAIRVQQREAEGTLKALPAHPMTELIQEPNPFYSGELLLMATAMDLWASDNAYWLKVRARGGGVVQLWYTPSTLIEPDFPENGSAYISHYNYRPDPTREPIKVAIENVVHFRFGLGRDNTRKGVPTLASLAREIYTDDEAANFTASLLTNLGIPGVILSPKDNGGVTPDAAREVKAAYKAEFGGDNRGSVMVMLGPTDAQVMSFSPQQMDLKALRRIPEERVTAIMGIPAIVVGLGAGLDRSTFANFREAREAAYEAAIIPVQRLVAAEIRRQLLRDFVDDLSGYVVDFDLSTVRVLQEDENARVTRYNQMLQAGGITVAEYRSSLGFPTDESHDIYLRPLNLLEVAVGATGRTTSLGEVDATIAGNAPKALGSGRKDAADDQFLRLLERGVDRILPQMQQDLDRAFTAAADEVLSRLTSQKALVAAGHTNGNTKVEDWPEILRLMATGAMAVDMLAPSGLAMRYLAPVYERAASWMGEHVFGALASRIGHALPWRRDTPAVEQYLERFTLRSGLVDLDGQTRDALRAALTDGFNANESLAQLKARVRQYVEGAHLYPGIAADAGPDAARAYRAQMIARTELVTAKNLALVTAARESGVIVGMRCTDGDDCGVTSHDDPEKANGREFTLEEAEAYPLAHPNCVRQFTPIVRTA